MKSTVTEAGPVKDHDTSLKVEFSNPTGMYPLKISLHLVNVQFLKVLPSSCMATLRNFFPVTSIFTSLGC